MSNVKTGSIKLNLTKKIIQQRHLFYMSIPFVFFVIVFNYVPIWGWLMAFQEYRPGIPFWGQKWVGFKQFIELFSDDRFYNALYNTIGMSLLSLAVNFTFPIIFALLINELKNVYFKKVVQTVSYLPHFVSWVVVASIIYRMLSTDGGPINDILVAVGHEPVQFMAKPELFWFIVTFADLWKELGWNTIIFLAAITAIDPQLYEAAKIDGANRWRQMWHITLAGISSTVIVLLVLSIGSLISIGFEKQFVLSNPLVEDKAIVLDFYALRYAIGSGGRFSFGTAIGVAKSVVSLILLFSANYLFKKRTGQSVM